MTEKRPSETGKHILFVDDEKSLALLGADLLEEMGYRVTCAFNGEEALELFQQQLSSFDLAITDVSMPGMSGIELAQELFRLSPTTPVIICSGHLLTMQEDGMDRTNISAVLVKTDVCRKLPEMLETIFSVA